MIHIAIVSHGHEDLLIQSRLCGLLNETQDQQMSTASPSIDSQNPSIKIWVKDNKPSPALRAFCVAHQVNYVDDCPGLGFGDNNNFVYRRIANADGFNANDTFMVVNPDIETDPSTVKEIVARMRGDQVLIATLNLYRDAAFAQVDGNIRPFPNLMSALRMSIGKAVAPPYDKAAISRPIQVDWASGAFLAFDAKHYARLQGFDTAYFMYFEDVDICYRSQLLTGQTVRYYPDLKATHIAAHKNRNFLSMHAAWFFQSFFRFLYRRYLRYRFSTVTTTTL